MDSLRLDLALPLRTFRLELALALGRETVALVGPSGGGKTTVLRAIAGLARPERGVVACDGEVWFDAARRIDRRPEERSVGLVFQEYALFPHLSVEQNVGFAARRDVSPLLERLRVAHLARERPDRLSGGERQRVALARALARDPKVLLLDEPMSALDPHTRADVRGELGRLLRELRLPTLLVTHDFEDASALADRVGILVEGRLRQLGSPDQIVAAPADAFVAGLAGGNLLRGAARRAAGGLTEVVLEDGNVVFSTDELEGAVGVIVYPWDIALAHRPSLDSQRNHLTAAVDSLVRIGNRVRVRVGPLTSEVTASSADELGLAEHAEVVASFKATATRLVRL